MNEFIEIVKWTKEDRTPRTGDTDEYYATVGGRDIRLFRKVDTDIWVVSSDLGMASFKETDARVAAREAFYRMHQKASDYCDAFQKLTTASSS